MSASSSQCNLMPGVGVSVRILFGMKTLGGSFPGEDGEWAGRMEGLSYLCSAHRDKVSILSSLAAGSSNKWQRTRRCGEACPSKI
jgi:hypothetical protein